MRNIVECSAILATLFVLAGAELQAIAYFNGIKVTGNVTFTQAKCDGPVEIEVMVEGLSPDALHGFHIHEKGDLGNDCLNTGAHYNPHNMQHAGQNETNRHVGDLGNIETDALGQAYASFSDEIITLGGSHSIIGRGVVVHADEDDLGLTNHETSQTTGNAGARIACGVIGIIELSDEDRLCSSNGNLLSGSIVFIFSIFGILQLRK